ncbi:MAG: tungsten ABC transporter substrate-binding protein [Chloroflexi bacterium RBG_16_56_11]|nr:MAG: tungsten ABC transporter substrate-binding protein [Chloroflexi bacterium RBG_16_56_11]
MSCTGETTTTTSSPTATQPPVTTTTPAVTTTPASTDVAPLPAKARFRVATTTSLYDTGLWGYLEPMFEKKYDVEVDILSLGSGAAFEYGKRGDVDVVTIHDKPNELKFVSDNFGVERVPFAYNYFLIVGPPGDPAGIKGMNPEDAFKKLMATGEGTFVSRGDNSGTHSMEKTIWTNAGFNYADVQKAGAWYVESGLGMGPTLNLANEKHGYTLADMATYVAFKAKLNLVPIVDKGSLLLNVYSVIAVNPEKVTVVKNIKMANNLVSFLTSPEIQELIGKYGAKEYGIQLFTPCAGNEPKG